MALKHKTAEMATINDTKKVCCDSENTCTILIHQQGIASVSICETMGFEIQTIYSPPQKKIAYALFSVSLGTVVIPG